MNIFEIKYFVNKPVMYRYKSDIELYKYDIEMKHIFHQFYLINLFTSLNLLSAEET